jgi:hypothetical protein
MTRAKVPLMVAMMLMAGAAWAGGGPSRSAAAPALGEAGLIALGLGLVATGVAFLRRK